MNEARTIRRASELGSFGKMDDKSQRRAFINTDHLPLEDSTYDEDTYDSVDIAAPEHAGPN